MSSQNPKQSPNLRRLQAVLNARYPGEKEAVIYLDKLRQVASDRQIITDALLALRKSRTGKNYTPVAHREYALLDPSTVTDLQATLTNAVIEALQNILQGMAFASPNQVSPTQIRKHAESAVMNTFNLVGNSMRFEDDED